MSFPTPSEYELLLSLGAAVHGQSDLEAGLEAAAPLLEHLIRVDHVAVAVSRIGDTQDVVWFSRTLPPEFLANHMQDVEALLFGDAQAAGDGLGVLSTTLSGGGLVQSVHLARSRTLSSTINREPGLLSGIALYRRDGQVFTQHDEMLLRRAAPQLASAIRRYRDRELSKGAEWLEPVMERVGLSVMWANARGQVTSCSARAASLVQQCFSAEECGSGMLPVPLRDYLQKTREDAAARCEPWTRDLGPSTLCVSVVPSPVKDVFGVVLKLHGLEPRIAERLPPRLQAIAGDIIRGLRNEEIAERDGRALATVKQQASDVYKRLGVNGRKGLLRLASGFGGEQTSAASGPRATRLEL